jgi:hypothetical protein
LWDARFSRRFRIRFASHDAALRLNLADDVRQAEARDLGFHLRRVLVAERRFRQVAARVTRGMRSGMRSNWVETMTVGTRTWSFRVEIEKSKSRTGSFTHSSQASGFK